MECRFAKPGFDDPENLLENVTVPVQPGGLASPHEVPEMVEVPTSIKPVMGDVGIVAVTDEAWDGTYTTRHFMLHHLTRFFRVAWLEPVEEWREMVSRWRGGPGDAPTVRTAGVEGVTRCRPLRWIPDGYRPEWLRRVVRSVRYASAESFLRKAGCRQVVLYVWRPSYVDALDSRQRFDAVIYHIDDEYSFSETSSPMSADELRLIREANAVIVHSPGLMALKGGINRKTFMVPNGVDYDLYARPGPSPADLQAIPAPRIGYVGVIKRQLDFALLEQLAERRADWSFVLVGPLRQFPGDGTEIEGLTKRPNVHFLGYRDVAALPAYQQLFDVCIMPYRMNAYTDCIYPLKLHEYLASGKPIVATPVRTLRDFSTVVSLASGVDAWVAALESCLTPAARSEAQVSARRAIAKQHDWRVLAGRIAAIITAELGHEREEQVSDSMPSLVPADRRTNAMGGG